MTEALSALPISTEASTSQAPEVQLRSYDQLKVADEELSASTKGFSEVEEHNEDNSIAKNLEKLQERIRARADVDTEGAADVVSKSMKDDLVEEQAEPSIELNMDEAVEHDIPSTVSMHANINTQVADAASGNSEAGEVPGLQQGTTVNNVGDEGSITETEQPSAQVDDAQEGRVHNIVQDVTTNGSDRDLKPDEVLETEQASDGTKEAHEVGSSAESELQNSVPTISSSFDIAETKPETDVLEGNFDDELPVTVPTVSATPDSIAALEAETNLPDENGQTEGDGIKESILADEDAVQEAQDEEIADTFKAEQSVAESESASRKEETDTAQESEGVASRTSRLISESESIETIPSEITETFSEEPPSLSELQSIRTEEDSASAASVLLSNAGDLTADDTVLASVAHAEGVSEDAEAETTTEDPTHAEVVEAVTEITPREEDEKSIHDHVLVTTTEPEESTPSSASAALDYATGAVEAALQEDDLRQCLDPRDPVDNDSISDEHSAPEGFEGEGGNALPLASEPHLASELGTTADSVAEAEATEITGNSLDMNRPEASGDSEEVLPSSSALTSEEVAADRNTHEEQRLADIPAEQLEEVATVEAEEEPTVPGAEDIHESKSLPGDAEQIQVAGETSEGIPTSTLIHDEIDPVEKVDVPDSHAEVEDVSAEVDREVMENDVTTHVIDLKSIEIGAMDEITPVPSTEALPVNVAVDRITEVKKQQAAIVETEDKQEEAEPVNTKAKEEDVMSQSNDAVAAEEFIPEVDVEVATPGTEINPMDEGDGMDPSSPLEQRLAEAIGLSAEEVAALPALLKDAASVPGNNVPVPDGEALTPTTSIDDNAPSDQSQEEQEDKQEDESALPEEDAMTETVEPVSADPPSGLAVDTNIDAASDRPKSPWTPSYSVTTQGPGLYGEETEQLSQLDEAEYSNGAEGMAKLQQDRETDPALSVQTDDLSRSPRERPMSPFPPSYSVTQMGSHSPGGLLADAEPSGREDPEQDEDISIDGADNSLALQLNLSSGSNVSVQGSEESPGLESASHVPEASQSPRSSLGALTPFDSRSEISEASHEPIAPVSPRSEPEVLSPVDTESQTPLMASTILKPEVHTTPPGEDFAPEGTPLVSAKSFEENTSPEAQDLVLPAPAVDFASGDAPTEETSAGQFEPEIQDPGEAVSVAPTQKVEATSIASIQLSGQENPEDEPAANVAVEEEHGTETTKIDVAPGIDVAEQSVIRESLPIAVTTTFSKDSAYTQGTDDSFASDQTEDTNVTTPDAENLVMPKLDTSLAAVEERNLDVFDDATIKQTSAGPASAGEPASRTPNRLSGSITAVGIGHNLARTFPLSFPTSPANEQAASSADDIVDDVDFNMPAPRRRLQSTASSLRFPGGWVTSPKDDRPSLEVATGEFSREGNSASAAGVLSPVKEKKTENEDKWRCVIM